jgi:hypothetical protein
MIIMYINPKTVKISFNRLKSNTSSGKSHLEKTSSLMYFLAFDALAKKQGNQIIDFPPEAFVRKDMALEYAKLVMLNKDQNGNTQQVIELGLVATSGKDPDKRISSNFFTVPLKKASAILEGNDYPNRPVPILRLGNLNKNIKWGITYHPDWQNNFPLFISNTESNAPFSDLAIFACRNDPFANNISDWQVALCSLLSNRFTNQLSSYWCDKIKDEKRFVKHIDNNTFFSNELQNIEFVSGSSRKAILQAMDKAKLIARVEYLESILDGNSIPYDL